MGQRFSNSPATHPHPPQGWGQPHQWVSSTSHALPTPIRRSAASPQGTGTTTSASHPTLPPPSQKRAPWSDHRVSQPYPQGTAWVCSGPSGGPSAPACWGRPVCSHSLSTGSASLEGDRSVGLIPALAVAVTSRAGAGLTWDRSALQQPQVLGWGPSAPCHRHRATGQSRFAATCQREAVRQRAPALSLNPCLKNHGPLCPPSYPLQTGVQATGGGSGGVWLGRGRRGRSAPGSLLWKKLLV